MFNTSFPGSDHQTILDWLSYTPDICNEGMVYRDVAVGCGCERVRRDCWTARATVQFAAVRHSRPALATG